MILHNLTVSPSPHINSKNSTQRIMLCVVISLIPAIIASGIIFGFRAILLIAVSVASCILFEYLSRLVMKRNKTIGDMSAAVTGILIALNVPVTLPLWMLVIGDFVAIVLVKQIFGGLGQNFANPAIVARIFLLVSFGTQMTKWVKPFYYKGAVDMTTQATPLAEGAAKFKYIDLFLGNRGGSLGETCILALLIGGIFLIVSKVISPVTPIAFIGTVALMTWIFKGDTLYQVLSGGLVLGAFFMATDYVTSPVTNVGKLIFGIGCGLITFLIRQRGSLPEGVSYAILIMNILTPYIDMITKTRPVGVKSEKMLKKSQKAEEVKA